MDYKCSVSNHNYDLNFRQPIVLPCRAAEQVPKQGQKGIYDRKLIFVSLAMITPVII